MKILVLNKNNYIKGGSDTYLFNLIDGFEEKGHEVIMFSMNHPNNFESKYSEYFVDEVNYKDKGIRNKVKNAKKLINSREAYEKLCKLIEDTKPDVAHINLIYHQLTPSVIHALRKYDIPMIYIVHDFKIICPNYKLYNNNEVCRKCYGGKYYNCFLEKCHKKSAINSLIMSIEAYYHKFKKSYEYLDYIVAPSKFVKNELELAGKKNNVVLMKNFLTLENTVNVEKKEEYVLYYGRLSHEKGIEDLLEVAKNLRDIKFKIVGKGELEETLKKKVLNENIFNVEMLGFKSGNELKEIIAKSKVTVQPANGPETFGLTVIESFALGTPVIAADSGALGENIDRNCGLLYKKNNILELKKCIEIIMAMNTKEYENMRRACIEKSQKYSKKKYVDDILNLYKKAMCEKGKLK